MDKGMLFECYKRLVAPGRRGYEEIIAYLKGILDIKERPAAIIGKMRLDSARRNAYSCLYNIEKEFEKDDFEFALFEISRNARSKIYYQDLIDFNQALMVLIEKKTIYCETDSNLLLEKIRLARGVDRYDYENDTAVLRDYLEHFDRLITHYGCSILDQSLIRLIKCDVLFR